MKRCPQCNLLYENTVEFCQQDGTPLIEESFMLPSDDDEPTIVRHDPIMINIPQSNEFSTANQPTVPTENIVVVPVEKTSSTGKYALFLMIGLLLGGGLVLATLLITRNNSQSANDDSNQKIIAPNQPTNISQTKPSIANSNANLKTPDAETASAKHSEPNDDANDGLFNGRVIVSNARIRRDPSSTAPVEDVLPYGDRLDIIDRANPNSPWYQVECEHGTTGWMHGDTIEFTKGNF
jgi:hypothetical protein